MGKKNTKRNTIHSFTICCSKGIQDLRTVVFNKLEIEGPWKALEILI